MAFTPGQQVKIIQNPRAPREDRPGGVCVIGKTGTVGDPAYSRLGYLRVHLPNAPRLPGNAAYLIHPENTVPIEGEDNA